MTETQLALTARKALGIDSPNEMQSRVWAENASRMVILSPTGSGKTVAFAGALLRRLGKPDGQLRALILAPSRELVIQISGVMRAMAVGYKVSAFYGRHSMADEVSTLAVTPDIVVATPGRLLDHINRRTLDVSGVRSLVIDEYDKCLELGFSDEMSRIARRLTAVRDVILTSATPLAELPPFVDMAGAVTVDYSDRKAEVDRRLHTARIESPSRDKLDTLSSLLLDLDGERAIVFVNHRESAERVFERLAAEGFSAALYHGGLEQADRDRAVVKLNNGTARVLVATDLAARGLDIDSVGAVVHYHLPPSPEAWTHRNGRTARVDATGRVFVITSEADNIPEYVTWDNDYYPAPPDGRRPSRSSSVTCYIDAGRKEKVSRGDIVGFLVKTAGLQAGQIGQIDVRDHCAYVAVAREAMPAIHAVERPRIKNTRVRLSFLK